MELRGKAVVLMGKNTMIRKALALGHEEHPEAFSEQRVLEARVRFCGFEPTYM